DAPPDRLARRPVEKVRVGPLAQETGAHPPRSRGSHACLHGLLDHLELVFALERARQRARGVAAQGGLQLLALVLELDLEVLLPGAAVERRDVQELRALGGHGAADLFQALVHRFSGYAKGTMVRTEKKGPVTTVILSRPERKNAVDRATAQALADAFRDFDADSNASVGVLWGDAGTFCSGADLKAMADGTFNRVEQQSDGPIGPSRMPLGKPVIAAISGHAVGGGLELALWCDLRVAEEDAVLGVFCRRWGVPLIDGGTVRLPRLLGLSRAMDLILTGRPVKADEALAMGRVNRVVPHGQAITPAQALASELAALPQTSLRNDRLSVIEGLSLSHEAAMSKEFTYGQQSLAAPELAAGLTSFRAGAGRHGAPAKP